MAEEVFISMWNVQYYNVCITKNLAENIMKKNNFSSIG